MTEYFTPIEVQNKMNMGPKDPHACKISMLWNWYTIDSCFLSKTWHVHNRGMFAGTCIGLFFWVVAYCWYHRFIVEYDTAIIDSKLMETDACLDCCGPSVENASNSSEEKNSSGENIDTKTQVKRPGSDFWTPLLNTFSHKWFVFRSNNNGKIYPSAIEHVFRSGLYLCEWTVSYLIMLMWMYYNGYLIITMILGYFFGQLIFNYTPLTVVDRKNYATPGCQ